MFQKEKLNASERQDLTSNILSLGFGTISGALQVYG